MRKAVLLFAVMAALVGGLITGNAAGAQPSATGGTGVAQVAPDSPSLIEPGGGTTASGPDVAASGYAHCSAGEFCAYDLPNGFGLWGSFRCCAPDLRRFGLDRKISSVWNRTSRYWCLYAGLNYTGQAAYVPPGGRGNAAPPFNNWARSLKPC